MYKIISKVKAVLDFFFFLLYMNYFRLRQGWNCLAYVRTISSDILPTKIYKTIKY